MNKPPISEAEFLAYVDSHMRELSRACPPRPLPISPYGLNSKHLNKVMPKERPRPYRVGINVGCDERGAVVESKFTITGGNFDIMKGVSAETLVDACALAHTELTRGCASASLANYYRSLSKYYEDAAREAEGAPAKHFEEEAK